MGAYEFGKDIERERPQRETIHTTLAAGQELYNGASDPVMGSHAI